MDIKHRNLELARENPEKFKKTIKSLSRKFGGNSQYRDWQYATREYHRSDKNSALSYLIDAFDRHYIDSSRNQSNLEDYSEKLENYINDFLELGNTYLEMGKRLNLDIENGNFLKGEIARIDKKKNDELEVFIFTKEDIDWESELRFPLLQYHFAENIYKVDSSKVNVGVYCFEESQHVSRKFSKKEVEQALDEVKEISNIISLS